MRARLVHGEALTRYDFGTSHPMGPGRVRYAITLAEALGVLEQLEVVDPDPTVEELVTLVHDADYVQAVREQRPDRGYGIGTTDNPVAEGMHEVAAQVCTATVQAARAVWSGEVRAAANISGGLHHAMPAATSGFCVYNDAAVAIRWLQQQGAARVAYVDLDAHHGDGVQEIFYDDPSVLTVSLHESPAYLFPGTGYPTETGVGAARGTAVNVALPPHTGDQGWLRAFDAVVPPVLAAFEPDIVVSQHGCDSHRTDPLTDLELSIDGMALSYRLVGELAERHTEGRWIALGGGGYSPLHGVARAWTHLLAVLSGQPVPTSTAIPERWREPFGDLAPETMGDHVDPSFTPYSDGMDPESPVDQAIQATRRAVFPDLGLDPEPY
ncbi:acetoin utilization protein AcuC [Auraticoccus monumenti]|uniref:Acetoin utilization protein AcuC n=1 Tax=Auraticoccus monumenti TaxID=675864 RepID=A0A1G6RPZ2_9ACTN|nr:acetoin utilization protein AcuC [Auraticoccus monumenti]